jgi:hypothetical protein
VRRPGSSDPPGKLRPTASGRRRISSLLLVSPPVFPLLRVRSPSSDSHRSPPSERPSLRGCCTDAPYSAQRLSQLGPHWVAVRLPRPEAPRGSERADIPDGRPVEAASGTARRQTPHGAAFGWSIGVHRVAGRTGAPITRPRTATHPTRDDSAPARIRGRRTPTRAPARGHRQGGEASCCPRDTETCPRDREIRH